MNKYIISGTCLFLSHGPSADGREQDRRSTFRRPGDHCHMRWATPKSFTKQLITCLNLATAGISGKFPSAKNIKQYAERLYGKADTTVDVKERWPHCDYNELPSRMGILPSVNQFDAGYFGISMKEANYMDAMCRMLLECAYEAIVDAGMSPAEFRGKRTAMIIGSSTFESEHIFYKEDVPLKTYCAFE